MNYKYILPLIFASNILNLSNHRLLRVNAQIIPDNTLEGVKQYKQGDFENALLNWQEAENLYKKSGNKQGVTNFYNALAQPNVTKAEAFRQAQLALIEDNQFSAPYYWASFVLVGNWR